MGQQPVSVVLVGQFPEAAAGDQRHLGQVDEDLAGVLFAHEVAALGDRHAAHVVAAGVAVRRNRDTRRYPSVHVAGDALRQIAAERQRFVLRGRIGLLLETAGMARIGDHCEVHDRLLQLTGDRKQVFVRQERSGRSADRLIESLARGIGRVILLHRSMPRVVETGNITRLAGVHHIGQGRHHRRSSRSTIGQRHHVGRIEAKCLLQEVGDAAGIGHTTAQIVVTGRINTGVIVDANHYGALCHREVLIEFGSEGMPCGAFNEVVASAAGRLLIAVCNTAARVSGISLCAERTAGFSSRFIHDLVGGFGWRQPSLGLALHYDPARKPIARSW